MVWVHTWVHDRKVLAYKMGQGRGMQERDKQVLGRDKPVGQQELR